MRRRSSPSREASSGANGSPEPRRARDTAGLPAKPGAEPDATPGKSRGRGTHVKGTTAQARLGCDEAQVAALAAELAMAGERERRRIAVDVHDTLSQSLVLAKIKLAALAKRAKDGEAPARMAAGLQEVTDIVGEVLSQTRTLTFELSPPVLYELGLDPALDWLAEHVSKRHGLDVRVQTGRELARLAEDKAVLLFQLVRELLDNAVKHAGARHVVIRPHRARGAVRVVVRDDGHGFDPALAERPSTRRIGGDGGIGFGLFSIRARLQHAGGSLRITSRPGGPTEVTVVLPYAAE